MNFKIRYFTAAFGLVWALTGCSGLFNGKLFKERAAETPAPNEELIDKSFFVQADGKPKTFLCAWAPEVSRGEWGEELLTPLVNNAEHCNIEFEITENFLIGKLVNPSFIGDRSRWVEALKIPIQKHFYYERDKDSHGRETNRWIENDSRSHWSARPKMKLNLAGIQLMDLGTEGWGDFQISSMEDVEWDFKSGFLGFSLNTVHRNFFAERQDFQGKFRVNFLRFEHDSTFKKVPYHQENSRYLNALHIMARRVEGVEPEFYVAHWDLRQPTRVYINGAPKELQQTIMTSIDKWNQQFVDAGLMKQGQRAFIPVVQDLKHPFDLRYPAVNYVADRRISEKQCLGIGVAAADVRNGKILWGSVTMFGGALEGYINAYTPSASAGQNATASTVSPFQALAALLPASFPPIKALSQINPNVRSQLINNLVVDHSQYLDKAIQKLAARPSSARSQGSQQDQIAGLRQQLAALQNQNPQLNQIAADLISAGESELAKASAYFRGHTLQSLLGSAGLENSKANSSIKQSKGDQTISQALAEKNAEKRRSLIKNTSPNSHAVYFEEGLTLENLGGSLLASPARNKRSYPEMLESVIAHLALHEFGHFLGLGHQFKENIVPANKTVPSRYIKDLQAKATAENEFAESTTVMGYRHGRTEMMIPASELRPGAHDDLVLRYLYKGQYAAFDEAADDWAFGEVPPSGKIPSVSTLTGKDGRTKSMRAAYFPQCNDYEASLATDPFCNRWDRGSSAEDIVRSYFEYVSDNLLYSLYSLTGGGSDAEHAEARLWNIALEQFSRVRIFYDEMRRRLRSEAHLKPLWDRLRMDKNALMEFSSACQKSNPTDPGQVKSEVLRQIFADAAMVDLCRANALALNEFKFFLNLPESDYTRIDHSNHYVSGGVFAGDGSKTWGHIFGSWYQLTNLPLKFSALHTLTSATPTMLYGQWLIPNWAYDNEENRYLYRTLYPREYTRLISDTVNHNMRFAASGMDDTTTMGRSILAAGSLLEMQRMASNDSARLSDEFNEMLDQQTKFDYSLAAIIVTAVAPNSNEKIEPDHYKKFTATIYDFVSGKSMAARNVFILPKGRVLVWANGMFLFPITKLKFYENNNAYLMAYKVAYDHEDEDDGLIEDSVKSALTEKHEEIIATCVNGFNGNGLMGFFGASSLASGEGSQEGEFKGFHIPSGISTEIGKEKANLFYKSIDAAFAAYEARNNAKIPNGIAIRNMRGICDEALRGVGLISSAAALINGEFLGITIDYLEK